MNFCLFIVIYFFNTLSFSFHQHEPKFEISRKSFIDNYKNFQAEKDLGMKTFSLEISANGFLRYKRTTLNNRVEYFSVRIDKISEMKYLGNEGAGWIVLKCEKESVIYQTYRDPKGDVDNMIDELKFPVKLMALQKLSNWDLNFNEMKASFLNTQK